MNAVDPSSSILITDEPIACDMALARFTERAKGAGAIVSFIGLVRDQRTDQTVTGLELQHYPGFTEKQIARFCEMAYARWSLADFQIIHRVGTMTPHDAIVFVSTAAVHRRAAFEACDFLMDYLKSEAPFWKKEYRNGEAVWIEPRAEDHIDKQRWES